MNFLSKTSNVQRSAVIWNAVSACLTSFQTMLLLMVLTHFGTSEHSGYFVMAYTAANLLMEGGAKEVYACASHAVLSGPALERLNAAPFKEIIVTDTIPLGERVAECDKIRVASIAGVLAKSIRNIHDGSSVSALF